MGEEPGAPHGGSATVKQFDASTLETQHDGGSAQPAERNGGTGGDTGGHDIESLWREVQESREQELRKVRDQQASAERRARELQAQLQAGQYRLEWSRAVKRRTALVGGLASASLIVAFGPLALVLGDDIGIAYRTRIIAAVAIFGAGALVGLCSLLVPIYLDAMKVGREAEKRARDAAGEAAEELADATDLPALIKANRKQMEAYDVLARAQAKTAFRNTQFAMAAGLIVLFGGAVIAIATQNTVSKITTASLTAIGGTLSGYIARTYLQTYFRAIRQLNFYFQQPLINSYLLSAQRLIKELSSKDKRDPALSEVIARMMEVLIRLPWSGGEMDGETARRTRRALRAAADAAHEQAGG